MLSRGGPPSDKSRIRECTDLVVGVPPNRMSGDRHPGSTAWARYWNGPPACVSESLLHAWRSAEGPFAKPWPHYYQSSQSEPSCARDHRKYAAGILTYCRDKEKQNGN